MANLEDFKLSELREMYPNIKDTSKKGFIEQVRAILIASPHTEEEVIPVVEETAKLDDNQIPVEDLLLFIAENVPTRNKILLKAEDSLTADELFLHCQYKLFPKLNEKGISVMASSSSRDMHLNGTCYVRIACSRTFDHLKSLMVYNVFKELV